MVLLRPGESAYCLGPLGTGFKSERGGGFAYWRRDWNCPLLYLAQTLKVEKLTVLLGSRSKEELFWLEEFKAALVPPGAVVLAVTDDGSAGQKGTVLDLLQANLQNEKFNLIYDCGPRKFLAGLVQAARRHRIPCQISLEDYMACGSRGLSFLHLSR